jgi:hypothetical protein
MEKKHFYFGVIAVIIFMILTVLLYIYFRSEMQQPDWVAFYVLIGLVGGLVFYLVDPLRSQEFKWKGIANIGGAAAIGAFFMFFAHYLTPTPTEEYTMDNFFSPPYSTWIPVDLKTGKPESVRVNSLNKLIPVQDPQPFKNFNLTLEEQTYDFSVTSEEDPPIYFGKLDQSDFERGNLTSKMEFRIEDLQIKRIYVDSVFQGQYPFSIRVYIEVDALKFKITHVGPDTLLLDRAANKELKRVLKINNKIYMVMVVLSVPGQSPAFAEFALGEIEPIFR